MAIFIEKSEHRSIPRQTHYISVMHAPPYVPHDYPSDPRDHHSQAPPLYSDRSPPAEPKRRRYAEPRKFLPVMFCLFTIFLMYSIFLLVHLLPMLQVGVPFEHTDDGLRRQGVRQTVIFHVLTALLLVAYFQSIITNPGEIPDNDLLWEYIPQDTRFPRNDGNALNLKETKRSGDRRHCKWCGKYKPDRCHHCRVCRTCVLKMDHHCPWIYNCVGHGNYKYFFLLLVYSVADLHLIFWAQGVSVKESIEVDKPFLTMFLLIFGETLAFLMGSLLSGFLCFHIWLLFKGMTTIEFCEKSMPKRPRAEGEKQSSGMKSAYDEGCLGNVCVILGNNPLLWFLPFTPSPGDGLHFLTREQRQGGDRENRYRRKQNQDDIRREDFRGGGGGPEGGPPGMYGAMGRQEAPSHGAPPFYPQYSDYPQHSQPMLPR